MIEIVLATRNNKKLKELKRLLIGQYIKVLGLDSFKGLPKVKEDRKTFRGNASKKAIEISSRIDKLVMADDSGLEVSALGNKPGINSARYAGPAQNDKDNIDKLLKAMRNVSGKKRRARFRCAICISKGRKIIKIVEGSVHGYITEKIVGKTGFGYDPIFTPKGSDKTFAQLGSKEKDKISHRAIALEKAKEVIESYFQKDL